MVSADAQPHSAIGWFLPGGHQLYPARRWGDGYIQLRFYVVNLRGGEQELPARLSADADPHRLLLLQERHAADRQLTHRLTLIIHVILMAVVKSRCHCAGN